VIPIENYNKMSNTFFIASFILALRPVLLLFIVPLLLYVYSPIPFPVTPSVHPLSASPVFFPMESEQKTWERVGKTGKEKQGGLRGRVREREGEEEKAVAAKYS
jgi:hypothetical protein